MKVAVIGCGIMGKTHANAYRELPGAELVGVCDFVEEAARATAEQYETQPYFSFEDMIEKAKPEAVSICLPTHLHKEYVIKAAERGVHVICEKPMAPTLSEAREMIEVCKNNGVRLFIAHVVRFFPSYKDITRQVMNGAVGNVGVVHTKRIGGRPGQTKAWYNDKSKSGGVIMDLMIHDIDFVRGIAGEIKSVYALERSTENMDYSLVTLRFDNGAMANLEAFWGYPGPFTTAVEVAGNKGVVRFNSEQTHSVRIHKTTDSEDGGKAVSRTASPTLRDPYYYELEHFLECIRTGAEPLVTAEDGYRAVEVSLAALESIRTGAVIDMRQFQSEAGRDNV